jgi:YD repeat-containing protein
MLTLSLESHKYGIPWPLAIKLSGYTYDPMDNITNKATEHGSYQYDYDNLYRLTNVDNPTQDDEGITYDSVGNRLTSERDVREMCGEMGRP